MHQKATNRTQRRERLADVRARNIFCILDLFRVLKIDEGTRTGLFHGLLCNPASSSVCVCVRAYASILPEYDIFTQALEHTPTHSVAVIEQ